MAADDIQVVGPWQLYILGEIAGRSEVKKYTYSIVYDCCS